MQSETGGIISHDGYLIFHAASIEHIDDGLQKLLSFYLKHLHIRTWHICVPWSPQAQRTARSRCIMRRAAPEC